LKDHRAAIAELDRAVALSKGDRRLHYTRAQVFVDLGELASTRRDFEASVKGGDQDRSAWLATAFVGLAYVKHQAQEYEAALADLEKALQVVKGYAPAQRQRALTLLALHREAEAGQALDAYLASGERPEAAVF